MDCFEKTYETRPRECFVNSIPDEILLKIFQKLTVRWLCQAILVNRHWRTVGEDPSLWRKFSLAVGTQRVKYLPRILKCSRFSQLERLLLMSFDPYDCENSHIDTLAILHSSVKKLEVRFVDMRNNMKEVSSLGDSLSSLTIHCCPIDQDQADQMFRKFEGGTSVKDLCFINPLINGTEDNPAGDGLSKVCPEVLGRGVANIESVKLHEVCLTVEQINNIMVRLEEGAGLKSLDVYDSINSKVSESSATLLASSFNKLESLTMYNACLGRKRTLLFLEEMSENSRLKHLNIRSNSLRGIPPVIMARAFQCLTSLNIEDTDISAAQLETFFQSLGDQSLRQMTEVSIGHNDLSTVDPNIFAAALNKIAKVNINATSITKEQVEELFKAILMKSSLKQLNLSTNDFSSVNTSLMAVALNKLEKAFMFYTGLTEHQVEAILNIGLKETNLVYLDLRHNLSKKSPNKLTKYIRSYVDEILL